MNDLVKLVGGSPVVTSKDIADTFGKSHRHVLSSINGLGCSPEFRGVSFRLSSYTSPQNKEYPCYEMTRNGFAFLCMGFTGKKADKFKEEYITAFDKMESYIRNDIKDNTLMGSINVTSLKLDELAAAGSAWGKTGQEIRRRKTTAIEELSVLINKAQMQLGF